MSEYLTRLIPQGGPLSFFLAVSPLELADVPRLHRFLLAYYRLLQANRELPHHRHWPLEPLSNLIFPPHDDPGVRYLAVRCYAIQSGMGEAERQKLERDVVGLEENVDCPVYYGEQMDGQLQRIDGWILPVIEAKRVGEARMAITSDSESLYDGSENSNIQPSDLRCDLFL